MCVFGGEEVKRSERKVVFLNNGIKSAVLQLLLHVLFCKWTKKKPKNINVIQLMAQR